jgi:AraC-like DNA-binding protein
MDLTPLVKEFEASVHKAVQEFFPVLVAQELVKIRGLNHNQSGVVIDRALVVSLRAQKMTQSQIARQLNCSQAAVSRILREEAGKAPATSDTPMKLALEKHGSKRAAAKALGVAETTYRERLAKELAA